LSGAIRITDASALIYEQRLRQGGELMLREAGARSASVAVYEQTVIKIKSYVY